jgi:hypothetical protein
VWTPAVVDGVMCEVIDRRGLGFEDELKLRGVALDERAIFSCLWRLTKGHSAAAQNPRLRSLPAA